MNLYDEEKVQIGLYLKKPKHKQILKISNEKGSRSETRGFQINSSSNGRMFLISRSDFIYLLNSAIESGFYMGLNSVDD
jgi:hypothetical protein